MCRGEGESAQEHHEWAECGEQLWWEWHRSELGAAWGYAGGAFGDELGVELDEFLGTALDETSL